MPVGDAHGAFELVAISRVEIGFLAGLMLSEADMDV